MTEASDFWSRRKAAVRAEQEADAKAVEDHAMQAELATREERSDAEILAELDLPDPDTLLPGDDIRGFMAKAVPERLRRRALRKLWKLNPVLANLDGMVDYGEDYTDSACAAEAVQTAYRIGKGMLAHVEAMARQAEAAQGAADIDETAGPGAAVAEAAAPEPGDSPETGTPDAGSATKVVFPPVALVNETEPDQAAPAPRRMRFAFED